jgi:hypothetical protein
MTYADVARIARVAYLRPLRLAHDDAYVDRNRADQGERGRAFLVRLLLTGPVVIKDAEPQALWGALVLLCGWMWSMRHNGSLIPDSCQRRYGTATARAVLLMYFGTNLDKIVREA